MSIHRRLSQYYNSVCLYSFLYPLCNTEHSGCKTYGKGEAKVPLEKNTELLDVHSNILQLYIVDIRSIGNVMLHEPGKDEDPKKLLRPITVDQFLQRLKSSDEPKDVGFQVGGLSWLGARA